jgi:hypothetical protein
VDKEVGLHLAHRLVDLHAAEVRIDPPTLPCSVSAPQKTDVAALARSPSEARS